MLITDGKEMCRAKYKELMGEEWVEENAFTIFDRLLTIEGESYKFLYEIYQSTYNGRNAIGSYLRRVRKGEEVSGNRQHKTSFLIDLEEETVTVVETY